MGRFGCLLLFAVSVLDGVVSPRYLVPGAEFASAAPRLLNIVISAYAPALVQVQCWYASVLPRRDSAGPTKERTQFTYIFH